MSGRSDSYRLSVGVPSRRSILSSLSVLTLVVAVSLSGLTNLPRGLNVGPVSLLGLLTLSYVGLAGILLVARPVLVKSAIIVLWPFAALLIWGVLSFLWYPPTASGVQNILVISTFLGMALLASYEGYRSPTFAQLIKRMLVRATWVSAALYAVGLFAEGLGSEVILSSRTFALFGVLGVACHLANWRHGSRLSLWWAVIITLLIAASLSRIALFTALILFPLSQVSLGSLRNLLRSGFIAIFVATLAYLAVSQIGALQDRFTGGDLYSIGGVAINTSGRAEFWQVVWNSYLQSPVIGLGAGSSEAEVVQHFGARIGHPHNDYLRILHDYGPLGLGLLVLGFIGLLWRIFLGWTKAVQQGKPEAAVHLAAFLSLIGVAVAMLTSNTIIYVFVMAPVGVLVGVSLGISRFAKQL